MAKGRFQPAERYRKGCWGAAGDAHGYRQDRVHWVRLPLDSEEITEVGIQSNATFT